MTKKKQVAVYGTLKQGQGNHALLQGSKFLGKDLTPPHYGFYSLGGFPAITLKGNTPVPIEVYEVKDDIQMERLNRLEGYSEEGPNNFYDRMEIDTKFGKSFIYFFTEETFNSFNRDERLKPITEW